MSLLDDIFIPFTSRNKINHSSPPYYSDKYNPNTTYFPIHIYFVDLKIMLPPNKPNHAFISISEQSLMRYRHIYFELHYDPPARGRYSDRYRNPIPAYDTQGIWAMKVSLQEFPYFKAEIPRYVFHDRPTPHRLYLYLILNNGKRNITDTLCELWFDPDVSICSFCAGLMQRYPATCSQKVGDILL